MELRGGKKLMENVNKMPNPVALRSKESATSTPKLEMRSRSVITNGPSVDQQRKELDFEREMCLDSILGCLADR